MKTEFPKIDTNPSGDTQIDESSKSPFVEIGGESFYRIERVDEMPTFLMNLVSSSDHWMFVASNGGLTAGRRDADNALFPYCTQDKLFELAHTVGSLSQFWIELKSNEEPIFWEPFLKGAHSEGARINLYKNVEGSELVFEALEESLGLVFRYRWAFSERFGVVRKASIRNVSDRPVKLRLLDGIQNIVPYGLDQAFVTQFSNLADAYKKNELLEDEGIGIYYLSSIPTDRAEPSEGLKATIAWSAGLNDATVLLSNQQLGAFRENREVIAESDTRGIRGSYLVEDKLELPVGGESHWWIVADINYDAVRVESLRTEISDSDGISNRIEKDVTENTVRLRRKVAASDGMQRTADPLRDARHQSNALFNIMRGGIFDDGYTISVQDFWSYLETSNRLVFQNHRETLVETEISKSGLMEWATKSGDLDLYRLACEYLPLTFSRRHGDPSRPWNKFSIDTQDEDGNPILNYQGNWRDIFQNWEALAYSFPEYLQGMIMRFLNTSTIDGYNPYRVTRDGFDWEILDPDEPWSNIGYWGDHQIVYLLKLLEASERFYPGKLKELLGKEVFVYADVPYRIRSFREIWGNPRETVDYDAAAAESSAVRKAEKGVDGKLAHSLDGRPLRANLIEKLLCPLLSKLSNFVPEGGIWMNTQRPEWNDANNALVGYGVSVVTLCYVNRYLDFLLKLLTEGGTNFECDLEANANEFLESQLAVFERYETESVSGFDRKSRFSMLEALGLCGEYYRRTAYKFDRGEAKVATSLGTIVRYLTLARKIVCLSIDANKREDGLYHSYNLLKPNGDSSVEIDRLSEMLEGQVAILSSGRLRPTDALEVMDALRSSALYREDAGSYMLYPDRQLPRFMEKNLVDASAVESSALLRKMLADEDGRILRQDANGQYRFNGDFRNSGDLEDALAKVKGDYEALCDSASVETMKRLFEESFDHRRFTGRSGTFFAYEGLGSIYWHMVSKLVLAVQENCLKANKLESTESIRRSLAERYFETLSGLGLGKTPRSYGAFPTDAYSHTPKQAGAQQPGMTGQVKEDLLTRMTELGLVVEAGYIRFEPSLLRVNEFPCEASDFRYFDKFGSSRTVALDRGELAYTFCQTLFVVRLGEGQEVSIHYADGKTKTVSKLSLGTDASRDVFARSFAIERIEVTVPRALLCQYSH